MSTKKKISILLLVVFSILMTDSGLLFSFGQKKSVVHNDIELYTPAPKLQPRINGPLVYGCRPGHPFLYRIPCQGERPIRFSVKGLPSGLKLNSSTGIITGTVPSKGEYEVIIQASNSKGKDKRNFKIVAGDKLALTPPMGWNHWYAHYDRITDKMMREAADIMISSGMADVGYQYVNIDDCWMNAPKNNDPKRVGPLRDEKGNILPNSYFPDMKGLTDYIHTKGLKAGIYTSPGPLTCGGFAGAYQHEEQDALQFAAWGFDFLKHDWCSYDKVPENDKSLEAYQKPYRQMGNILKSLDRDIVFNLCQYGMGDVWKWGAEVRVYHMWNESLLGVARNDIQRHKLIFSKPTISPPGSFGKKDYIIWNTREGMTKPGRWYLDRTAGRLVYWPLESEDMARMKIIAPKIEQIIRIAGDPDKKAENITIRGLTLQATTIPLKSAGFGGSAFDGALSMINTQQCILEGLEISNVGGVGISAIKMIDCRIIDCHIHNTGACGVKFNNSSDLFVSRNHIHDAGLYYPSSAALYVNGSNRLHIYRNEIHDAPYSGMIIGGTELSVVEENLIYRVMREIHDGAAIYTGGVSSCILRGNFVRDLTESGTGYGVSSYYLDEGSHDCIVEQNISIGVARPTHNHIARNSIIRDNVFITDEDMTLSFQSSAKLTFERNTLIAPGRIRITSPNAITTWKDNKIFSNGRGKNNMPQAFTIDSVMPYVPIPAHKTRPIEVMRSIKAPMPDGDLATDEWTGAFQRLDREPSRQAYSGAPVMVKFSWDNKFLYIGAIMSMFDITNISQGDKWGKDDGVEISVGGFTDKGKPVTFVIRAYVNGTVQSVTDAGATALVAERLGKGVRFVSKIMEKPRKGWIGEWAIPFGAIGLKPKPDLKVAFNMCAFINEYDNWHCWEGTQGESWQVDQAGILQFIGNDSPKEK